MESDESYEYSTDTGDEALSFIDSSTSHDTSLEFTGLCSICNSSHNIHTCELCDDEHCYIHMYSDYRKNFTDKYYNHLMELSHFLCSDNGKFHTYICIYCIAEITDTFKINLNYLPENKRIEFLNYFKTHLL